MQPGGPPRRAARAKGKPEAKFFIFFYSFTWGFLNFFHPHFHMPGGAPGGGPPGCMDHACGFILLCAAANRRDGR